MHLLLFGSFSRVGRETLKWLISSKCCTKILCPVPHSEKALPVIEIAKSQSIVQPVYMDSRDITRSKLRGLLMNHQIDTSIVHINHAHFLTTTEDLGRSCDQERRELEEIAFAFHSHRQLKTIVLSSLLDCDRTDLSHFSMFKTRIETEQRFYELLPEKKIITIRLPFFFDNLIKENFVTRQLPLKPPLRPDAPIAGIAASDVGRALVGCLVNSNKYDSTAYNFVSDVFTFEQLSDLLNVDVDDSAEIRNQMHAELKSFYEEIERKPWVGCSTLEVNFVPVKFSQWVVEHLQSQFKTVQREEEVTQFTGISRE
ncbi:hypothetical protein GEMRC1_010507 [Eukaryota sp. GEM-RC1]